MTGRLTSPASSVSASSPPIGVTPNTSTLRTAYPSMAAWSKPGSGRSVTTSSAHIRPCASAIATRTGRAATAAAVTRACCSSTERTTRLSRSRGRDVSAVDQPQTFHQPPPQIGPVVVALQRKVNRSLEVAAGISQVVSIAAMDNDVHRMALVDQQRDRVGQLDLTARPARDAAQRVEDRPVEHVPAGRGIVRRRILGLRLLVHAFDA